jgi:hypothetical protein
MTGSTTEAIFYRINRWFRRPSPYRGALVNVGVQRFEARLFAVLWAVIALLVGLTSLQLYKFFEVGELPYSLSKPKAATATPLLPTPENNPPTSEPRDIQSLFHLKEEKKAPLPLVDLPQEEQVLPELTKPAVKAHSAIWQLEVHHSALQQSFSEQPLTQAQNLAQTGRVHQAHEIYEHPLAQDPNHAAALAGVWASSLGEQDQQQEYLNRVSQETPNDQPEIVQAVE